MSAISLKKTAELLAENDGIMILCHRNPDGDTIGSAFALCMALRRLGKKANVMCGDIIPPRYSMITDCIEYMPMTERFVVAVDIATPGLLGLLEKEYGSKVDLCIDHHETNSKYAKNWYVDSSAAAAGEIIFELLRHLGVELDTDIARALYTALSTDTGCFRYTNVTPRTHRIAAKLVEFDIKPGEINYIMFEQTPRSMVELQRRYLDNLEFLYNGAVAIISISEQMITESGVADDDFGAVAAFTRRIEGVKVGILMRDSNGGVKISMRTAPGYSASKMCGALGGGGHNAAAGAFVNGTLEVARDKILEVLRDEFEGKYA